MIADKVFNIVEGGSRLFPSDIPIKGKLYIRVFKDVQGQGDWDIVDESEYIVANDTVVFSVEPKGKYLVIQVSTTPSELTQTPTENTMILAIQDEIVSTALIAGSIVVVGDNISQVVDVSDNMPQVVDVGDNISQVVDVGDNIEDLKNISLKLVEIKNISDNLSYILQTQGWAEGAENASVNASQSEQNASQSEQNASQSEQNASQSEQNAYKWANESFNVEVEHGKYSSYHWSEIAKGVANSEAYAINYDNTTSGLTVVNVQDAIDEVDYSIEALRTDLSNPNKGAAMVARAPIYVGSVAELEALSLAEGVSVKLTDDGVAGAGVIKAGTPPSDPLKGKYVVIANGNYWERDTKGFLFPQFFGSGGVDDQIAIEACRDLCETTGDAMGLYGMYSYETAPNLAVSNLKIYPFGEVVFQHTGTGHAFVADAGAVSGLVYQMEMLGPIIVEGNANSDSVLLRALIQCKLDIEVREMTGTAFDVRFGVLSKYKLASTVNRASMTLVPTKGIVVDGRGAGEFNAVCDFDLIFEGIDGLGVDFVKCSHATITGTSEGNTGGGVRDRVDCKGNTWQDFYCEENGGVDFMLYGERNHFINPTALSWAGGNNVELITAEGTIFEGGFLRTANCQELSKNSTFISVATSDHTSLGIKGTGTKRIINCVEQDINAVTTAYTQDILGDSAGWLPTLEGSATAGSATYITQNGDYSVIGDQMTFNINLTIDTLGGATGTAILPLPSGYVAAGTSYQSLMVAEVNGVTLSSTGIYLVARILVGNTAFALISVDPAGSNTSQSVLGFSSGDRISLCGTIIVKKI
jgi:hypothetical protein